MATLSRSPVEYPARERASHPLRLAVLLNEARGNGALPGTVRFDAAMQIWKILRFAETGYMRHEKT